MIVVEPRDDDFWFWFHVFVDNYCSLPSYHSALRRRDKAGLRSAIRTNFFACFSMAYTYSISDQGAMHFITCTVVQWADVFTRKVYVEMIEDSLNYCIDKKGLVAYGYVVMSNHIHLPPGKG